MNVKELLQVKHWIGETRATTAAKKPITNRHGLVESHTHASTAHSTAQHEENTSERPTSATITELNSPCLVGCQPLSACRSGVPPNRPPTQLKLSFLFFLFLFLFSPCCVYPDCIKSTWLRLVLTIFCWFSFPLFPLCLANRKRLTW